MSSMTDLLARLEKSGISIGNDIIRAMETVNLSYFTKYELEQFWDDRPVPFFETDMGATKTISAPHMIVTMLYHLELRRGQNILLMGSKGGYLAALIDQIIGKEGSITIIEPHDEVRIYTKSKIRDYDAEGAIEIRLIEELMKIDDGGKFDRILITGFVKDIPEEVEYHVIEGGFILGPLGSSIHQRLIKKEKQNDEWMDTDLGGVVFGPMDLKELEKNPLDPRNLAEHMESALKIILEVIEIEEESLERIDNLIWALRDLPLDIPTLDEYSSEEDFIEHPVMELLMSEIEWLGPLWPLLTGLETLDISSPGSLASEDYSNNGGHEDLIP